MNPKIKKRWLAALRGGKYRQGRGCLHRLEPDTYCCLGVLCDLLATEMQLVRTWDGDLERFNGAAAPLPEVVAAHVELPERAEALLVTLNDRWRYTFDEIAKWIDINL